jgi:hypothetical protein
MRGHAAAERAATPFRQRRYGIRPFVDRREHLQATPACNPLVRANEKAMSKNRSGVGAVVLVVVCLLRSSFE